MTLNWAHHPVVEVSSDRGGGGFIGQERRTKRVAVDLQHHPSVRQRVTLLWHALGETFEEYCETTKVNGPYYWQAGVSKGRAKIFWIIVPIGLLATGLLLVTSLWQRYLASPTRMTIGTPVSVTQVPFPAISLCHPRAVVEYKALEFIDRIKLPAGVTKERLLHALPTVGVFTEHQWAVMPAEEDVELVHDAFVLNNISIFSASTQLGKTCEDFLVQCRFAGRTFPCLQQDKYLSWTTSTSHYGVCCSFNYKPLSDDFQPFRANTFGSEGGLSVIVTAYPAAGNILSGDLFSRGLVAMIHHPMDYALETSQTVLVSQHEETFVAISPTVLRCNDQVLALPESQRNCIDPQDYDSQEDIRYRQSTCLLSCLREAIQKACQCHPFHLPEKLVYGRTRQVRGCNMKDALCLATNYAKFKVTQCTCLPLCNDVSYVINAFTTRLFPESPQFSVAPLYRSTNMTDFEFIVHFYMSKQIVPTNKRIVVMSWITLLSNLGGVFSLCMGISVISLIEIVYFLGIRVRHHYVQGEQKKRADQLKAVAATRNVVQVLQLAKTHSGGGGGVGITGDDKEQQQQQRIVMMTRPGAGDGGGNRFDNPEVGRRPRPRW